MALKMRAMVHPKSPELRHRREGDRHAAIRGECQGQEGAEVCGSLRNGRCEHVKKLELSQRHLNIGRDGTDHLSHYEDGLREYMPTIL